jgi:hypothetical protein
MAIAKRFWLTWTRLSPASQVSSAAANVDVSLFHRQRVAFPD